MVWAAWKPGPLLGNTFEKGKKKLFIQSNSRTILHGGAQKLWKQSVLFPGMILNWLHQSLQHKWKRDVWKPCRDLHWLDELQDFLSNLLLKIIIHCVTDEPSMTQFPGIGGQLDLQLCTGFDSRHADLYPCLNITLRPMNDRKIERSDERCFGQ